MSTRRARIKAVVALPPRRKNADSANKPITSKENQEKIVKSPRTPKSNAGLSDVNKSPKVAIRTPPPLLPINTVSKTPIANNPSSPVRVPTPINESPSNTIINKISVITSSASATRGVFASPQAPSSPDQRQGRGMVVTSSAKPGNSVESIVPIYPGSEKDTYIVDDFTTEDSYVLNASGKNEVPVGNMEVSFDPIVPVLSPVKVRPKLRPVPRLAPHSRNINQAKGSPDRRRVQSPIVSTPVAAFPKPSSHDVATPPPTSVGTPSRNQTSSLSEDYNIPSVPSTTEDVLDSLVPLPPPNNNKTVEMLKNEILSEIGDVSFDPIVPLPSACKVRPKIRPVPRLAPHRRNSVQGSASESEDESRRALHGGGATSTRQRHDSQASHSTHQSIPHREANRHRNDSICSSVSQIATQPPPATSPVKEKHISKGRRQEMARRSWSRRQVKRDALTMYDLIFCNPTTNPIIPDQDEVEAKEANAKEEAERQAKAKESSEPPAAPPAPAPEAEEEAAPVPQIKLGPNGEIILDEQSLVIKQSDNNRKVCEVVREGSWAGAQAGGRYTRAPRTAEWSAPETVRFYRALAALGTDFMLMAPLFPGRNRRDLYLKFKKEEKLNGGQVDKALRSATPWDATHLQKEFKEERAAAAKRAEEARLRLLASKKAERERLKCSREFRVRSSRAAKALESSMEADIGRKALTADEIVQRHLETKRQDKYTNKQKDCQKSNTGYATITNSTNTNGNSNTFVIPQQTDGNDYATVSRHSHWSENSQNKPISLNGVNGVPKNIESGSLVVLRVNDPSSPSKTMLQTYIAHGSGSLTPVALPSTFLNSVVGYMKKGTPKSTISSCSSPQILSPNSVVSQDSRSGTPSVIQLNPSPSKRQRHSSYTITSL